MPELAIRRSPLIAAFVCVLLVLVLELGAPHLLGGDETAGAIGDAINGLDEQVGPVGDQLGDVGEPPGRGISYLALVDVFVLFLLLQYVLTLVAPARLQGRLTGIITLVGSFLIILAGFVLLLIAVVEVLVMVSLFLAAPFGTIAYLGRWGGFPRNTAAGLLTTILTLQVVSALLLVVAHPKLLRQRGLVVVTIVSLVLKLILGFLHGLVPRPLVAISDDVGAIVTAICGLVIAVVFLVLSVPAIGKMLRVDRLR
jgi:hypothetical protein